MKRFALVFPVLALAAVVCHAGDSAQTIANAPPAVVMKFLGLFDQLRAAETQKAHGKPQQVAFQLSDSEIDEYMRYSLHAIPRPGLDSVTVKFFPANYISTFTVIDFDAVEQWHPGTIPSLLRPVLSGRKSIWVDYRMNAKQF